MAGQIEGQAASRALGAPVVLARTAFGVVVLGRAQESDLTQCRRGKLMTLLRFRANTTPPQPFEEGPTILRTDVFVIVFRFREERIVALCMDYYHTTPFMSESR